MDALKAMLVAHPPGAPLGPPPPSPVAYVLEDNLPDVLVFMGFTVYGVSFFFALTEFLEQDFRVLQEYEYGRFPVFLLLGLLAGLVSYALAFLAGVEPGRPLHSLFTMLGFVLFAKHLTRHSEMPGRRAYTVIMVGALPLLCLAVLEAGSVRVRSARFFFALMLAFAAMPLPHLFREWVPGPAGSMMSHDANAAKVKRRTFALFFFSFLFVAASTPMRRGADTPPSTEARQSAVVFFDLLMAYYALDGLWTGGGDRMY
jgi:hypothetical protein